MFKAVSHNKKVYNATIKKVPKKKISKKTLKAPRKNGANSPKTKKKKISQKKIC